MIADYQISMQIECNKRRLPDSYKYILIGDIANSYRFKIIKNDVTPTNLVTFEGECPRAFGFYAMVYIKIANN